MFALGYLLQRLVINRASHGKDENILLVTLGLSIVLENLALVWFKSDTRSIDTPYALSTVEIGPALIALPKLIAFGGALAVAACLLWLIRARTWARHPRGGAREAGRPAHGHRRGKGLRAVVRHRHGLPGRGRLFPAAGVLRQSAGRRRLRAGGLHHRGAGRHGQLRRRIGRRAADRRGRVAGRPVPGRLAGPDGHLRHLHPGVVVPIRRGCSGKA